MPESWKDRLPNPVRRGAHLAWAGVERVPALLRVGARPVASIGILLDGNVRRSFPWYWRRRTRLFVVVVAVWIAALVGAWLTHWLVTVVVIAPFAGEAGYLAWRRRAGWGARRGVPPGNVGVGPEPICTWGALAVASRRYGPLFKSNYFNDPMVVITDLDLATRVFREHADDLGHRPLAYDRFVPGGAIRWAPEPRHTQLRRSFTRALSPRVVTEWTPAMHRQARSGLAHAAAACAASGQAVDPQPVIREFARAFFSEMLLGVPSDDPAYREVRERMPDLETSRSNPVSDEQTEAHLQWFVALVRERAARARDGSPATVASELASAGALDDEGVVRNLVFFAHGPRDDVAGLLVWVLWYLVTNPRWIDALRSRDAPADLADRVVSETLRLDQSEYVLRRVERDVVADGFRVPAGWMLRACIREIHRDPSRFPDPERFDPDRFADGKVGRDRYAPFGIDHHSCIGEDLTRAVARSFVTELATGFDVAIVDDGPRLMSVHGHWAPDPAFRVRIEPVTSAVKR